MKKKNSQLTFLHCYHHFFMALGCYVAVKWLPGGHGLLLGMINLYVHGIMYFYYFLTSFKPELKQSIWWKKHITQVQLVISWLHLNEQIQISFFRFSRFNLLFWLSVFCVLVSLITVDIQNSGSGCWWYKIHTCLRCLQISIEELILRERMCIKFNENWKKNSVESQK